MNLFPHWSSREIFPDSTAAALVCAGIHSACSLAFHPFCSRSLKSTAHKSPLLVSSVGLLGVLIVLEVAVVVVVVVGVVVVTVVAVAAADMVAVLLLIF